MDEEGFFAWNEDPRDWCENEYGPESEEEYGPVDQDD